MAGYQLGDRVQLTEECGSSIGTIHNWTGGPGPLGEYHLTADWHDRLEGASSAGPGQIAELVEPAPPAAAFEVGQQVILGTRPGVVAEDWGDGRLLVEVEVELTKLRGRAFFGKTNYVRRHLVAPWQLKLENRHGT